ncbi:right-handed parallel beta-helix repeat-containing protein [Telluria mixta]|uniref:Right-handed parallel beta-helix repeat-containing protein n=1 Tax=Telluria mixta TaxID=34071 RepID=A0ABT2BV55_9BURK|nr:choice-of-anchor Q domain-containing protein [Telluria mixta]MCS0628847.1 right-handed parallel beta-helix repeat-containing protein [Telluria mixta]WEM97302.1 choice-of-anchor Q domain-containing protein [Telluria mixta]
MKKSATFASNIRANVLLSCGAVVLLAAAPMASAVAKDLYVSTTGSDSNPGTQAAPVKTIARADALASAGTIIHVAAGTYRVSAPSLDNAGIKTSKSGTATARIKFVSDVKWGAKIIVSGTGITWDSRGSYVDIDGFDISGSGRHGILAAGANLTMTNNFVHDLTISGGCNGSGGAAIDTYGPVGGVVIDRNVVRNIGASMIGRCNTVQGIYIANANNVVTNNLVSGVAMAGIQQWHGATASTIVNNTVFHTKDGILLGQGDAGTTTGSANNYVANNVVYDNTTYGIVELGKMAGNNRYVNNLVAKSGTSMRVAGSVSGTISSDPLFVAYQANGTGNYRLSSSSPAIDRGTSTSAPRVDLMLVARPRGAAIDIGAYEF